MKAAKSIVLTLVCALAILAVGYGGILLCGEHLLKSSAEPQPVTMNSGVSGLFYSKLEDDVDLYPWNYYPKEEDTGSQKTEMSEIYNYMDAINEPYLFYNLIGLAADVNAEEVEMWYKTQERTIMDNMKQGMTEDNTPMELFFYDDIIELDGNEYHVKISCYKYQIVSFSCIRCKEDGICETEEWEEKKAEFLKWSEQHQKEMAMIYEYFRLISYNVEHMAYSSYSYVGMYDFVQNTFQNPEKTYEELEYAYKNTDINLAVIAKNLEEMSSQVIELDDSLLWVMSADTTVGVYYDVIDQRVAGFHFFNE